MRKFTLSLIWIISIAVFIFVLDQMTKMLAVRYLGHPVEIIGNFFTLTLYRNEGIAFSINLPQIVIIALTYILLFTGIYMAYRELNLHRWLTRVLLGMVLGGSIGNLVDRMLHGFVVDFFTVQNYPVFNIADIGVTVGLLLIVILYDRLKKKSS